MQHKTSGTELQQLGDRVKQVSRVEVRHAAGQLDAAVSDAKQNGSATAQAGRSATQSATDSIASAQAAIEQSAAAVRGLLSERGPSPAAANPLETDSAANGSNEASNSSPDRTKSNPQPAAARAGMGPKQMAQLLDELDRQLNRDASLGPQDNNQNTAGQQNGASQPTPDTLAEAARQLAASLSRARQPPAAAGDVGMATEVGTADTNPQPPVAVRMLDVDRIDGDWGKLRAQSADEMVESRRDVLAPSFRRQVDAYFRAVSERSHGAESNAGSSSTGNPK